jgi:hypothetical protein
VVGHVVIAGMTIHQSPHPVISGNHDSEASQDVRRVDCDVHMAFVSGITFFFMGLSWMT